MTRKSLFVLITFLLPPLMFVVAEISLRLFGYGEDLRLVVEKDAFGKKMFAVNRNVARRYFTDGVSVVPEPSEDLFRIEKGKKTIRIFCLGESTMAGFPYEFNATGPAFLKRELEGLYPGYDLEVINVGLAAVGTFVVRDFLSELREYEPDLFLVYVGHNEFYGIYGPASSIGTTIAPWITDLSIYLTHFKIYLALRDLLSAAGPQIGEHSDGTLMGQMASHHAIPLNSDTYELTRRVFSRNIEDLILEARDAGVPIMFSGVVSNLADQPPFLAAGNASLPPAGSDEFHRRLRGADSLREEGSPLALNAYGSVLRLDSLHAGPWFGLGQTYRQQGDSVNALECLSRARDLDALRFRMSGDFQQDLREICRRHGVSLSPVDSVFAAASPLGLVGNELILEHLHPNLRGYALMAETWARTIIRDSLLSGRAEAPGPGTAQSRESREVVTAFDSTVGFIRTSYLTRRWPFPDDKKYRFDPGNTIEEIALRYVQKKLPWQSARYEAAAYYAGQRHFDLARREAYAVASVIPFSYEPLLRVADYYLQEGKREEAREAYARCVEVEENPYAWSKIGWLHVEAERFNDAVLALNNAFAAEGRTRYRLPVEAAVSNRYLLGYAYAKLQKRTNAIRELKLALALNPGHAGAVELLDLLQKK